MHLSSTAVYVWTHPIIRWGVLSRVVAPTLWVTLLEGPIMKWIVLLVTLLEGLKASVNAGKMIL